jgi:peptidoglycan/xylan/chitin deacetylase (PgdA/CDA1 family)
MLKLAQKANRHARAHLRRAFGKGCAILYYHRVKELAVDPFEQAVLPELFRQQLECLQERATILTLSQVVQMGSEDRLPRRAVAITFDDGYADNLYEALPLLERYGVPATFFIASGYVGGKREFWWDELERIFFFSTPLPEHLELTIGERVHQWNLKASVRTSNGAGQGASPDFVFRAVHSLLRDLHSRERDEVIESLLEWSGAERTVRPTHRTLTTDEVARLAGSNLVEIGAHTLTHASLPLCLEGQRRAELVDCKRDLETMTGREVKHFSYPYGAHDQSCAEVVRSAGYASGCTVSARAVRSQTDPYLLPRFWARPWRKPEFECLFENFFAT